MGGGRKGRPDDDPRPRAAGAGDRVCGGPTLWILAGLAAVAFTALALAVVARSGAPFAVDLAGHREALAHRSPLLTGLAVVLTTTGSGIFAYLLASAAGALLGGRRRRSGALAACAALGAGQLARLGLAHLVARPRPPAADWAWHAAGPAFPSGHTTTSALVAALACAAVVRRLKGPARRTAVAAAVVWAVGVGATRIYLGVHWPTDVVAGWLLAGVLALGATAVWRHSAPRRTSR